MADTPFWQTTPLAEMSPEQWESLCDGCGQCCVLKLEDVDTGHIYYTDVACKLLDCNKASCTNYPDRKSQVPDCVLLTPDNLAQLSWMPMSCAYRRLYEGRGLPDWHPLVSGTPDSVREAGISVAGRVIPEAEVAEHNMPDHIVIWPDEAGRPLEK